MPCYLEGASELVRSRRGLQQGRANRNWRTVVELSWTLNRKATPFQRWSGLELSACRTQWFKDIRVIYCGCEHASIAEISLSC